MVKVTKTFKLTIANYMQILIACWMTKSGCTIVTYMESWMTDVAIVLLQCRKKLCHMHLIATFRNDKLTVVISIVLKKKQNRKRQRAVLLFRVLYIICQTCSKRHTQLTHTRYKSLGKCLLQC